MMDIMLADLQLKDKKYLLHLTMWKPLGLPHLYEIILIKFVNLKKNVYLCTQNEDSMQQLRFNPAQYELINLLSCVDKEEDIIELKEVLVQFLNRCLQREIDKLWDAGIINEKVIEDWGKEHMRTPYKHAY